MFLILVAAEPLTWGWGMGAAATKYHRLEDLNNRNEFSYTSGGSKSRVKMSIDLFSSEASCWLEDSHPLVALSHGSSSGLSCPWCLSVPKFPLL